MDRGKLFSASVSRSSPARLEPAVISNRLAPFATRAIFLTFSLAIAGFLPNPAFAQRQLVALHEDVPYIMSQGGNIPRWTNNRLTGCSPCEGRPILYEEDARANRQTVNLDIPGADFIHLFDVAAGADGSLAAVGLAISGDSRMGTFIVRISPDLSRQVVTRVWPYGPAAVAMARDGTLWTVGAVMNDNYREVYPNVLRHYAASGEILTSTLVQRPRAFNGLYKVSDISALMASNDRIGWMTTACQYFEYSFDGAEMGRYTCPGGVTNIARLGGVALSSANDMLVMTKRLTPLAPLQLDRAANSWKPVTVLQDSGNTWGLFGFDGLTLVTSASGSQMMRRYALSGQPSLAGQ